MKYKYVIPLTRAFFGLVGVDCFIIKDHKRGFKRILSFLGSIFSYIFFNVTLFRIYYSLTSIVFLLARIIYYFVTGIRLINKGEDKVRESYFEENIIDKEKRNKIINIFVKIIINLELFSMAITLIAILFVASTLNFITHYGELYLFSKYFIPAIFFSSIILILALALIPLFNKKITRKIIVSVVVLGIEFMACVSCIGTQFILPTYHNINNIVYMEKLNSVTVVRVSDKESLMEIVIEPVVNNKPVTKIKKDVFSECSLLSSITLPDSVKIIGDHAFSNCDSLNTFNVPNNVTSIGSYAFYDCDSLKSINIPSSVTSIGNNAFFGCDSLTIYCETEKELEGWNISWNYTNCPVIYGYKED